MADADAHIRLGRFPVPFADLVGGSGEEYCPLPDGGIAVRSEALGDFHATVWRERLRLDDGEAVATFAGVMRLGAEDVVALVVGDAGR